MWVCFYQLPTLELEVGTGKLVPSELTRLPSPSPRADPPAVREGHVRLGSRLRVRSALMVQVDRPQIGADHPSDPGWFGTLGRPSAHACGVGGVEDARSESMGPPPHAPGEAPFGQRRRRMSLGGCVDRLGASESRAAGPAAVHRAAVPRILLGELAHCFDRGHSESVPGQATHWQTEDRPGPLRNRMIIFALVLVRSGQARKEWPSNNKLAIKLGPIRRKAGLRLVGLHTQAACHAIDARACAHTCARHLCPVHAIAN